MLHIVSSCPQTNWTMVYSSFTRLKILLFNGWFHGLRLTTTTNTYYNNSNNYHNYKLYDDNF